MTSDDLREILEETDLFGNCAEQVVSEAVSSAEEVSYAPDEQVFESGSKSTDAFVVVDGSARVERSNGKETNAAFIARRPDVFGLLTALTGEPRRANVTITSDNEASFLRIDIDEMLDQLEDHGSSLRSFYDEVVEHMSKRLLRSSKIIDTFL